MNKEFSAFSMDAYFDEQERKQSKKPRELDKRTVYELLHYDFIEEDLVKHPAMHIVRAAKMRDLINENLMDYCLLITTSKYKLSVIKRKVESLPDNNNLIPATYDCAVLNNNCKVIERFGQIASKKVYDLFAPGNFR
ncbi:MAG: hypothetical protein J5679_02185 [Alphaproteobacteria bacterium]|nr:hypothetical protein [Alphaproteobacteria bacterium]